MIYLNQLYSQAVLPIFLLPTLKSDPCLIQRSKNGISKHTLLDRRIRCIKLSVGEKKKKEGNENRISNKDIKRQKDSNFTLSGWTLAIALIYPFLTCIFVTNSPNPFTLTPPLKISFQRTISKLANKALIFSSFPFFQNDIQALTESLSWCLRVSSSSAQRVVAWCAWRALDGWEDDEGCGDSFFGFGFGFGFGGKNCFRVDNGEDPILSWPLVLTIFLHLPAPCRASFLIPSPILPPLTSHPNDLASAASSPAPP